ncbi:MAG: NUDIX hydrolase [Isosphaeraceae bacterium]
MSASTVPKVDVVVALIMDHDLRLLWTWNEKWGAFALPMTKLRKGEGIVEPPEHAAARAGAEALGVPVKVGVRWRAIPELKVSDRDYATRLYAYDVFRVEAEPRFAPQARLAEPHLWLSIGDALSDRYQPLSESSTDICQDLVTHGLLPQRSQHTSTLVVARDDGGTRRYLLRWDGDWGFALPTESREPRDDALEAARRVAVEELELTPDRDIKIERARVESYTTHGSSASRVVPTFYLHALFDGTLLGGAEPKSNRPLAWASIHEIRRGRVDQHIDVRSTGLASPGEISWTAIEILAARDA